MVKYGIWISFGILKMASVLFEWTVGMYDILLSLSAAGLISFVFFFISEICWSPILVGTSGMHYDGSSIILPLSGTVSGWTFIWSLMYAKIDRWHLKTLPTGIIDGRVHHLVPILTWLIRLWLYRSPASLSSAWSFNILQDILDTFMVDKCIEMSLEYLKKGRCTCHDTGTS